MQFVDYISADVMNIIQNWVGSGEPIAFFWGKNSQSLMRYWRDSFHVKASCVYDNLMEQDFLPWGDGAIPVRRIGNLGKEYHGEKIIVCCAYETDYAQVSKQLQQ